MTICKELFNSPHKELIQERLPVFFHKVEMENSRSGKVGMEVGTARENVLIALLTHVYGPNLVEIPESTRPEVDVLVDSNPISIKTKTGTGLSGIKLSWTVDSDSVEDFVLSYKPKCSLLYINIRWGEQGGFYLIPTSVQQMAMDDITVEEYVKIPRKGTNPRGIEISKKAMKLLLEHEDTLSISIDWQEKEWSQLLEMEARYKRWLGLWGR